MRNIDSIGRYFFYLFWFCTCLTYWGKCYLMHSWSSSSTEIRIETFDVIPAISVHVFFYFKRKKHRKNQYCCIKKRPGYYIDSFFIKLLIKHLTVIFLIEGIKTATSLKPSLHSIQKKYITSSEKFIVFMLIELIPSWKSYLQWPK